MKRVIIIGCPGAGKSHFARRLHQATNIPLYYLDCIYWKENWVNISDEEFDTKLNEIMNRDSWIIDGNYQRTLETRFIHADTIFFLDFDEEVCIKSEKQRRGTKREDLPNFLEEKEDPEFINFIKNFKNNGKILIESLIKKYSDKEIYVLKTRDEEDRYLKKLI